MPTALKTNKIVLVIVCFLCAFPAHAGKVLQVKNDKIMIDLEGEEVTPEQTVVLVNAENKKVALAKIEKSKNGKAMATVTKGQSKGNETVSFPAAGKVNKTTATASTSENSPTESTTASDNSSKAYRTNSKRYSALLTVMSNNMTTKQTDGTNTEDVAMKSSTFGLTGAIDWPLMKYITGRGTLGYEPFKATGTSTYLSCDSLTSKNCTAEISYLSAGGYLRIDFNQSRTQFWGGLGANMKYPISKSTTALKSDDIKMTVTYAAALGMDFFLTEKMFIPASVEQQMFLKSDTVSANILMVRVGFGQTF